MICVTITPRSRTLAKVDLLNAAARGDMVEICLDHLVKDPDFTDLLEGKSKPVLLSCRRPQEGGAFEGTDEERTQLLKRAIVAKPDYIELDLETARSIKRFGAVKRVVSFTRFDRPEPRPAQLIDEAKEADADIVKLVWPTPTLEDAWPLLQLTVAETKLPVVALGVGQQGLTFTLLGLRHGAPWVYAALEPGMEVCEGQPTLFDLDDIHHARGITPKTTFIGLTGFGDGARRAMTALNTTFVEADRDARCLPLDIRSPNTLADRLERLKIRTLLPVGETADLVSPLAEAGQTESPDVLLNKDGQWKGFGTIDRAALKALKKAYEPDWSRANVMVLGLTRLARTIAAGLIKEGAMVSLCSVGEQATAQAATELGCRAIPLKQLYSTLADVVVVADPALVAGTGRTEVNPAYFRPNMTVLDVTSVPELHTLGREAIDRGANVVQPAAIYALHLDAVLKTLTGGGLSDGARAAFVENA